MTRGELIQKLSDPTFTNVNNLVYQYLFDEVTMLRMHPGSPISESALSKELGISRTPIRNALKRLETDGLVVLAKGNHAKVSPLYPEEYHALCEIRAAVECPAAYAAAVNITDSELNQLKTCLQAIKNEELEQTPISVRADTEFHEVIIKASRNPFFYQSYQIYRAKLLRYRLYMNVSRTYRKSSTLFRLNIHTGIYNALRFHFPDQAQEAVRRDIESMRNRIYSDLK